MLAGANELVWISNGDEVDCQASDSTLDDEPDTAYSNSRSKALVHFVHSYDVIVTCMSFVVRRAKD